MDPVSIAASLAGAKASQTLTAVAARLMKMNAESDSAIVSLLQSADQGSGSAAKPSTPGTGTVLDISV